MSQFLSFISDYPLLTHLHSYTEGWQAKGPQDKVQVREGVVTTMLRFLTGETRPPKDIALESLLKGEEKQGNSLVAVYSERFLSKVRILEHTEQQQLQRVLCIQFLAGLTPALAGKCATTPKGESWTSLEELIKQANMEELKLTRAQEPTVKHHAKINSIVPSFTPFQKKRKEGANRNESTGGHKKPKQTLDPKLSLTAHPFFTKEVYMGCKLAGACYFCREPWEAAHKCTARNGQKGNHPKVVDEGGNPLTGKEFKDFMASIKK